MFGLMKFRMSLNLVTSYYKLGHQVKLKKYLVRTLEAIFIVQLTGKSNRILVLMKSLNKFDQYINLKTYLVGALEAKCLAHLA